MGQQSKVFTKGLNQDLDYRFTPEEVYISAHNIRIFNDDGGSSMSINNMKGNAFNITIPSTTRIQQIKITSEDATNTLQIDGELGSSFSTFAITTYKQLYDYIINDSAYTHCVQNPNPPIFPQVKTYDIFYGDNYLLVVPLSGFTLVDITHPAGAGLTISPNYVPAQSKLQIIGSTSIRNDIYLFTTNSTSQTPTSVGQIWKYTYDKITFNGTLELIYNNYINFSTYWCIAPTAALGRYENLGIQRIYWTDNYNKLRTLNVANSQSMAIDPSVLDITPGVDLDIPLLTNIDNYPGPNIKVGSYQLAYRLKNTGGAITTFSELSNQVFVADGKPVGSSAADFKNYIGKDPGNVEGNHITWIINNVDRDFDRIEFAIVVKEVLGVTPTYLSVVNDFPITADDYSFTYAGDVETVPLTENEFLALIGVFTHCKTIATKDNRLFAANIRNQQAELDFDCRAFRSYTNAGNDIYLVNNGTSTGAINLATAEAFDEAEDTINDYTGAFVGTQPCLYNPVTGNFGGAGVNISYEFVTIASACDIDLNGQNKFERNGSTPAPWRYTNPNYETDFIDLGVKSNNTEQEYTNSFVTGKTLAGLKYSNVSGVLKGLQRNEIYRFGIQFYDKSKNPYFVKWIGDIKMPDFFDSNPNSFYEDGVTATGITDFRLSFTAKPNGVYFEAFVQSLGIKFTVDNLDKISNQISGYSIVRVKRQEKDKTIISNGIINQVINYNQNDELYMTSQLSGTDGNTAGSHAVIDPTRLFYVSPNISNSSLTGPTENMTFKVKALLKNTNGSSHSIPCSAEGDPYFYWKYYKFEPVVNPTGDLNLDWVQAFIHGGSITDLNGPSGPKIINNFDVYQDNITNSRSYSIGNSASIFRLNGSIDYTDISGTSYKLLGSVERVVTSQYGGATYVSRASNEYISTGHFRLLQTTSLPLSDTFDVFGGDVFVNMYDSNRWSKNYQSSGRPAPGVRYSSTQYFPCESAVNTELRYGKYMNKDYVITGVGEFNETYDYNGIYSSENDVRTYFPKPDPFINNDEWDNRFYASDKKINGELVDSWGLFNEANVWDVEGIYGPINAIEILKDKLYFWQNRAFGLMEVNPRAVVQDVNNTSNPDLQLGTGLPLQRHDYISTEVGLQHQWGLTKSSYKLFWTDVANKKFYSFGGELTPESDIKGMFSFFTNNLKDNILNFDKPVYEGEDGLNGIRAVYDFKYNQAIFTYTDSNSEDSNQYTLIFDEMLNAFTTFTDFTPKIYFTDGYKVFSTDDKNLRNIYMHDVGDYGKYYGTIFDSKISFAFNKDPKTTKVFDNLFYDSQALDDKLVNQYENTWTGIRFYNDSQNTDYQTLTYNTNIKRKERVWKLAIPRNRVINAISTSPDIFDSANLSSPNNKPFGDRIRGPYVVCDLKYSNANNYNLVTNNVTAEFRNSER